MPQLNGICPSRGCAGVSQLLLRGAAVGARQVKQAAGATIGVAAQAGDWLVAFLNVNNQLAAGGVPCGDAKGAAETQAVASDGCHQDQQIRVP